MKVGREGRVEYIAAEPKPRESVDAFSPPGHPFQDEGPQAASRKESLNAPALSLGAKLSPSESAAKGIAHWAAMLQEAKTPEEVDLIRASLDQTYQDYQTHLKGWKGWALSPFRSALAGTGAISSPQQIEEAYKDAVKQSIARAQTTRSAQDIAGIMRRVAQNMELLFPDKKAEIAEILGLTKQRLESAKSQDPATEKKILDNLSTIAFTLTNATSPALRFKTLDHLVLEAFKQYAGLTLDQNLRAMFYKKPENERMATMRALQRTLSDPAFASRSREETKSHFVKAATEEKLRMAGVPKANIEPLAQLI